MKNNFLIVCLVVILSGSNLFGVDIKCKQEGVIAPEWICNPVYEGLYTSIGVSSANNIRQQIKEVKTIATGKIKKLLQKKELQLKPGYKDDIKVIKIWTSPSNTLYSMYAISKSHFSKKSNQKTYKLLVRIPDKSSINVMCKNKSTGKIMSKNNKISFLLEESKCYIKVEKSGYKKYLKKVILNKNIVLKVSLTPLEINKKNIAKQERKNSIVKKTKKVKKSPSLVAKGSFEWKDSLNPYPYERIEKIGNTVWERPINRDDVYMGSWSNAKKRCKSLSYESDGFIIDNFKLPSMSQLKNRYKIRKGNGLRCRDMWSNQSNDANVFQICSWQKGKVGFSDNNKKNIGLCVSSGHFVYDKLTIYALANKLLNASNRKSSKLVLSKKPIKKSYRKMTKGEFETTTQYNKRVQESNKNIDLQNQMNLKNWKENISTQKIEHKNKLKRLENYNSRGYVKSLQKAMHIKYGSPKVNTVKYNADKEKFTIVIKGSKSSGGYKKTYSSDVMSKYAQKTKNMLSDKNFKPTVLYSIINDKLVFKGIKELKDNKGLIEEDTYNAAKNDMTKLKLFISKYPNSEYRSFAEQRIEKIEYKLAKKENRERLKKERIEKINRGLEKARLEQQKREEALKLAKEKKRQEHLADYKKVKNDNSIFAYQWFIKNYSNSEYIGRIKKNIFEIVKEEDNIVGYEWFIKNYSKSSYIKEAISRIHGLAYEEAEDIDTISSYNTFIIAYPSAKEVKKANKNAYKMEVKKYTDLGMMSFVGSEGKLEKKARKLLIKAKQIERTGKEYGRSTKIGYMIVANRMYDLLQEKFDDTDATLRYLESQEFQDFVKSFKNVMNDIKRVLSRIENNTSDLEKYAKQIVDISRQGFSDSKSDREMTAYHEKKKTQWDKLMHYRDKGYN